MTEEMESGLEVGTDREAESKLEGFVGGDYLGGVNDWIPVFTGTTINEAPTFSAKF